MYVPQATSRGQHHNDILCNNVTVTEHTKTRQDKTRQDKARQDKARQGKARQDKARQDKTRQDKTRHQYIRMLIAWLRENDVISISRYYANTLVLMLIHSIVY
jgi:hypothetical protein